LANVGLDDRFARRSEIQAGEFVAGRTVADLAAPACGNRSASAPDFFCRDISIYISIFLVRARMRERDAFHADDNAFLTINEARLQHLF
jgi:hypothetical protein